MKYLCADRALSPVVGTPVYVKDDALRRQRQTFEHRGGVIIEDMSVDDDAKNVSYAYKVKHANRSLIWRQDDLVEIGGLTFNSADITPGSEDDH